jgi:NADPH2:quinone reductase
MEHRMYALTFDTFGGPEVLAWRELADPAIPPGHIQLAMHASGLNFADIYRRRGHYALAGAAPHIAGYEGAGEVVAVGAGVDGIAIGDRIGFADVPFAHATRVTVPVTHALPLPPSLGYVDAAALLLQGLTAQYLVEDTYAVRPGDLVLIHAAAGGVGQYLVQLAVARGATVIALASTPAKRAIAIARGARHSLGYDGDWVAQVLELTGGGAHVAYDAVGVTLADSLRSVRTRGTLVTYGMAGGMPTAIDPRLLMNGSKTLAGGDLWDYLDSHAARLERAGRLFALVASGAVRLPAIETFALARGVDAHRRLEDRSFAGKVVLMPD